MRSVLVLALITVGASNALAQAYRCTVGGQTVYQQQPCEGGAKLKSEPAPDPESREYRLNRAIALKQVFVGMTEAELIRSRGKPFQVTTVKASNGPADVWYYEKTAVSPRQSIMVRSGKVVNVQQ